MTTSSRVIKNTIFLYLRMAVVIFVGLYSTRLVLQALGAADFGIFNVIGGSIAMLGFFNSTLSNATQRFMSCALAEGIESSQIKVFNVTIVLHLVIGIITVLALLIIMPLLFRDILNISQDRIFAAKIIYYCLIFSTFLTIINVPYVAIINAHENMGYYTLIGFLESFLKLAIAILCIKVASDRLILYGICMAIQPLITLSIMKVYCHRKYPECIIAIKQNFDLTILKNIASFSGWNFLTAISHLLTLQGVGLVLNHFFGTVLNAAQGISNQVNSQLSNFSSNMMKALNPVITKKTAKKEMDSMNLYSISGCKYSCFLFLLFAVPVVLNINYILKIWLKDVPEWTACFCIMQLIKTLIEQSASPISTSIYATGRIKNYAIFKSITNVLPIMIIYLLFKLGGSPFWLYIPVIIILGIGGNIVILIYAKIECALSLTNFYKSVVFPVIGSSTIMLSLGYIAELCSSNEFLKLLICGLFTTMGWIISIISFGITHQEKTIFISMARNFKIRIFK